MSTPGDEDGLLRELEGEVEAELTAVESSRPEGVTDEPVADWQFDPADTQRLGVGLRSLLGAVKSLEHGTDGDPTPGGHGVGPPD